MKFTSSTLFSASVAVFLIALLTPFEKNSYETIFTWMKFSTDWRLLLSLPLSVWFAMLLLITSWIAHREHAYKNALVFSCLGFLVGLISFSQPNMQYGMENYKTYIPTPQIGYYLLLVSLIFQMMANGLAISPEFSKRNRFGLISLMYCMIGVVILMSVSSFIYQTVEVGLHLLVEKNRPSE
jgi:hypothetical protein